MLNQYLVELVLTAIQWKKSIRSLHYNIFNALLSSLTNIHITRIWAALYICLFHMHGYFLRYLLSLMIMTIENIIIWQYKCTYQKIIPSPLFFIYWNYFPNSFYLVPYILNPMFLDPYEEFCLSFKADFPKSPV